MPTALQKKVEKFETWFDKARVNLLSRDKTATPERILKTIEKSMRMTAITQAYIEYCVSNDRSSFDVEKLVEIAKIAPAEEFNEFILSLNDKLPIPLPETGNVMLDISKVLRNNKENILRMGELAFAPDSPERRKLKKISYILEFFDSIIGQLGSRILHHPKTEFMLIEKDLAKKVLDSNNESIGVEDLYHIPFKEMILEFSDPIEIYKGIKGVAVAFFRDFEAGIYSVIWYTDVLSIYKEEKGYYKDNARISIAFSSIAPNAPKIVVDPLIKDKLFPEANVDKIIEQSSKEDIEAYGPSKEFIDLVDDFKEKKEESDLDFNEMEKILSQKSKNIWDFVSCRNIDYEIHQRSVKNVKMKKFKHLQGKNFIGPRFFKILKINKKIKIPGEVTEGQSSTQLGYQEHVPGCFHKWVYCLSCGRVHRKDLIGLPCRNPQCNKQVGPFSNIEIKKYWHSDYWRGDGIPKQTVREILE